SPRGIVSGDTDYYIRCFWECALRGSVWLNLQSTVSRTQPYGGREHVINWSSRGNGMLRPGLANPSYGQKGVAISQAGELYCTLYTGELYDNNTCAIVPKDSSVLPAVWAFCSS